MAKTNTSTKPEKKLCPTCMKMLDRCLFQSKPICMECRNLRGIKSASTNSPETRDKCGRRMRLYGVSQSDYNRMLSLQGNRCAICRRRYKERERQDIEYVVDHSHETGEVRGLLCAQCNSGLGMFKDDIESLQNAIKYLEASKITG